MWKHLLTQSHIQSSFIFTITFLLTDIFCSKVVISYKMLIMVTYLFSPYSIINLVKMFFFLLLDGGRRGKTSRKYSYLIDVLNCQVVPWSAPWSVWLGGDTHFLPQPGLYNCLHNFVWQVLRELKNNVWGKFLQVLIFVNNKR